MKWLFTMLVASAALFGCKKDSSGTSDTPDARGANPASGKQEKSITGKTPALAPAPSYVTANAQNRPAENVVGDVDAFLTHQLQIFIQQNNRLPESFAEFAGARLDSMPRPPEGRKWVIDTSTRQVKAAPEK